MHTGTGRIARMKMHTMSLYESGDSTGEVSLTKLFDGKSDMEGNPSLSVEKLAFIINRGGWPEIATETDERVIDFAAVTPF